MEEWSTVVKLAIGAVIVLALVGIAVFIIYMTQDAGFGAMDNLDVLNDYESFEAYDGKTADKATSKNIIRANFSRIPIRLWDGVTLSMVESQDSLEKIQTIYKNTGYTKFTITCTRDSSGNITGLVITAS